MGGRHRGELIYGIGHVDYLLPITENGKKTKEYEAWRGILKRCFDDGYLNKEPTYRGCSVSEEWTYYRNFYYWITSQENYAKWKGGKRKWALDKDILCKGNKVYSSETCLLVPMNVNNLFTTRKLHRGQYPIGVSYSERLNKFLVYCMNPFQGKTEKASRKHATYVGAYNTESEAFNAYKIYKENIISRVAQEEFGKGNITKECYLAMLKYRIDIND